MLSKDALLCVQGDSKYAKDCLYWEWGKCKQADRNGKKVDFSYLAVWCRKHVSREGRGIGEALGA